MSSSTQYESPEMVHALPPSPVDAAQPALGSGEAAQAIEAPSSSAQPASEAPQPQGSSSPDARAVADAVYELMKKELILARNRERGGRR